MKVKCPNCDEVGEFLPEINPDMEYLTSGEVTYCDGCGLGLLVKVEWFSPSAHRLPVDGNWEEMRMFGDQEREINDR